MSARPHRRRTAALLAAVALAPALAVATGSSTEARAAAGATVSRYVHTGGSTLNVRQTSAAGATSVGALANGARVVGLLTGSWLRITAGPYTGGYVSSAYLTGKAPTRRPTTPGRSITAWVATDDQYAAIHSSASFTSSVTGRYAAHAKVVGSVVGTGPWIKTAKGYVNSGTLEVYAADPSTINGRIPATLLCPVPLAYNAPHSFDPGYTPTTRRYLNCAALSALDSLQAAFKKQFGHYATIDLTYRSLAEQQYWYKKFGYPRAAVPGTSNHGYGLAIDFEEDDSRNGYSWGGVYNTWLFAHQSRYGLLNPFAATRATGEDYHFTFVG